jgi:hypothetical protein
VINVMVAEDVRMLREALVTLLRQMALAGLLRRFRPAHAMCTPDRVQ